MFSKFGQFRDGSGPTPGESHRGTGLPGGVCDRGERRDIGGDPVRCRVAHRADHMAGKAGAVRHGGDPP